MNVASGIHPLHGHYNLGGFVALAILSAIYVISWVVPNKLTRNVDDNDEMFETNNDPYVIARALPIVGLAYAVQSIVGFSTAHWWQQALWAIGDGVGSLILFALLVPVLNYVFRKAHGGIHALLGGSVNVSLVSSVFGLAFGLVVGAVLPGPGYGIIRMAWHSLVFIIVSAALIIALYLAAAKPKLFSITAKSRIGATGGSATGTVYTKELSDAPRIKRSLAYAIENGNWSATMFAATFLFGLGILTSAAAASSYSDEFGSLVTLVVGTLITLAIVGLVLLGVDKAILTKVTLKDVIEQDLIRHAAVSSAFMLATFLLASWLIH